MKGYVQNAAPVWAHIMKRSIGPSAKIPLTELYEQYGKKYGIAEGQEFVGWLRSVKLRDSNRWRIVLEENLEPEIKKEIDAKTTKLAESDEEKETTPSSIIVKKAPEEIPEYVKEPTIKEMNVKDVVGLSVRRAREVLPKIRDLNLLKYAMQEANQLSGKDSLCILLRKRIREIQIAR